MRTLIAKLSWVSPLSQSIWSHKPDFPYLKKRGSRAWPRWIYTSHGNRNIESCAAFGSKLAIWTGPTAESTVQESKKRVQSIRHELWNELCSSDGTGKISECDLSSVEDEEAIRIERSIQAMLDVSKNGDTRTHGKTRLLSMTYSLMRWSHNVAKTF